MADTAVPTLSPSDTGADELKLSIAEGDPLSEYVDDADAAGGGEAPPPSPTGGEGDEPGGEGGEGMPGEGEGQAAEVPPSPTPGEGEGGGEPAGEGSKPPAWSTEVQQLQQQIANLTKRLEVAAETKGPAEVAKIAEEVKDDLEAMSDQIEQRLADPKFDSFENGPDVIKQQQAVLRAMQKRQRQTEKILSQVQTDNAAARENAVYETYWGQFARDNPEIGRSGGEALWQEAVMEVSADKSLGNDDQRAGAAQYIFKQKVAAKKATAAAGKPAGKVIGNIKSSPSPAKVPAGGAAASGGKLGLVAGRANAEPEKPFNLDERVKRGDFKLIESFGFNE
ncbi:MAG: hypothetical protein FWD61_11645 [Phycisphaerales bacterium]|nr:hypothetical protein [Phycisphaerales bacterium]